MSKTQKSAISYEKPVWTKPAQAMRQLLISEDWHDIWFVVEGKKFGANKVIMVANSAYFDKLLEDSIKDPDQEEIEIEGVTAKTFKQILEFCYVGQVDLHMDDVDLQKLMAAAQQYQLDILSQAIANHVSNQLHFCNWEFWMEAAFKFNDDDLKNAVFYKISSMLPKSLDGKFVCLYRISFNFSYFCLLF